MKALLLCGYRSSDHLEDPLGLTRDEDGVTLIDRRIAQLQNQGFEVVCVVSGATAEEQLRHCTRIANTELVYDDSPHVSLSTNLKFGLDATDGEGCWVLPVEVPFPPQEVWDFLREEWRRAGFHTEFHVLQAIGPQGAPWHFGFPLLITRKGNAFIRSLESLRSLVDTRLKYLHQPFPAHADLASHAKAA